MASNEWYVDPVSGDNANGGTSDGDAWETFQYALDNLTQSTTDGDYVNLKSSGTHTLTANVDWTSITKSSVYPLTVRGYDSTAGDGGITTVECDGYTYIKDIFHNFLLTSTIKFQNTGTAIASAFESGHGVIYKDCIWDDFDTGGASGKLFNCNYTVPQGLSIIRCVFTDVNGTAIYSSMQATHISSCHFYNSGTKDMAYAVHADTNCKAVVVTGCLFNLDSTSVAVKSEWPEGTRITNNTFYTTGTGTAIVQSNNTKGAIVENNIFEGWSKAIDYGNGDNEPGYNLINNHFYDNTTDIDSTTYRTFVFDEGNFKAAGASVLAKSGANTHANRATYFAPIGDAIAGAADGNHDIGAYKEISAGGGGFFRAPDMTGGMNG